MAYLPDELMHEIFQYLEFERPTLLSIAKSSRRFHRIAQPISFRHIEFSEPSYISLRNSEKYREKSKALLNRSLDENSALRKCVRSIGPMSFNDYTVRQEVQQLQTYPNLEGITVENSEALNPGMGWSWAFTTASVIKRLQWMKLIQPTEEVFRRCSHLHSLYHLCLKNLNYKYLEGVDRNMSYPSIVSFDLYDVSRLLQHTDLGRLLGIFSGLRHLRIIAPLGYQMVSGHRNGERIFEGTGIINALSRQHTSLETLELAMTESNHIIASYGVPLHFGVFEQLRHLKISAMCLFDLMAPCLARNRLSDRIFPSSLERLEVVFPRQMGIFYSRNEWLIRRKDLGLCLASPCQYEWLLQFPILKRRKLHNLGSVCLAESDHGYCEHHWPGNSCGATELWDPVDTIKNAYLEMNLELSIRICISHFSGSS